MSFSVIWLFASTLADLELLRAHITIFWRDCVVQTDCVYW